MNAVLYVHGKGGNATECEHYAPFFPDYEISGLDYQACTPWEAGKEILSAAEALKQRHEKLILIANSIGAYFSLCSGAGPLIHRAFFISPIVDMEKLICSMMEYSHVEEKELKEKGTIRTEFQEDLSWEYLCWVRSHPIQWNVPTCILYGGKDTITSYETIKGFAQRNDARLTVMENGEHWFHAMEQMEFLDAWLRQCLQDDETQKKEASMNIYTAYCGLDCKACEARIATERNDDALRDKVAALWSKLNGATITPEMINCTGCRTDGVKTPYCDFLCPIRQCALSKGVQTCGSCHAMDSCEKLAAITKNNPQALLALKQQ